MQDEGYEKLPKPARKELDEALEAQREENVKYPPRRFWGQFAPEYKMGHMDFDVLKFLPPENYEPREWYWGSEESLKNIVQYCLDKDSLCRYLWKAFHLYREIQNSPVLALTPSELEETRTAMHRRFDMDVSLLYCSCYEMTTDGMLRNEADNIILLRLRKYLDAPEEQLVPEQRTFREHVLETIQNDLRHEYRQYILHMKKRKYQVHFIPEVYQKCKEHFGLPEE